MQRLGPLVGHRALSGSGLRREGDIASGAGQPTGTGLHPVHLGGSAGLIGPAVLGGEAGAVRVRGEVGPDGVGYGGGGESHGPGPCGTAQFVVTVGRIDGGPVSRVGGTRIRVGRNRGVLPGADRSDSERDDSVRDAVSRVGPVRLGRADLGRTDLGCTGVSHPSAHPLGVDRLPARRIGVGHGTVRPVGASRKAVHPPGVSHPSVPTVGVSRETGHRPGISRLPVRRTVGVRPETARRVEASPLPAHPPGISPLPARRTVGVRPETARRVEASHLPAHPPGVSHLTARRRFGVSRGTVRPGRVVRGGFWGGLGQFEVFGGFGGGRGCGDRGPGERLGRRTRRAALLRPWPRTAPPLRPRGLPLVHVLPH
ncbi:hypothetical protein ACIA8J_10055 [Streptomyces asoensis]|uniref:hypothetical protein n=1 Tax=Streptomyces asoensis TaxID=249586 RepID=UPI0037BCC449